MTVSAIRVSEAELPRRTAIARETISLIVGVTVTLSLFLAIAHFKGRTAGPATEIAELRPLAGPPEPLPPKLVPETQTAEEPVPFAGLAVESSNSPVKIAVVPPDLAAFVPTPTIPPTAVVQFTQPLTDLKPRVNVTADLRHVYRQAEVDQRVTVLSRPDPVWPRKLQDVRTLRTTFLLIVNTNGTAENVRLMSSSGYPAFDRAVEEQIKFEWVFSPAMKSGHKVRCLVEQAVVVSNSGQSRFHL